MWTHSTFCRARDALQMFRSLLRHYSGSAYHPTLPEEPPALAVRLGTQRRLLALHFIAAQIAVNRRRPAPTLHHYLALATPSTLDALLFDRHFSPLSGHHVGFL